eukprot:gb/GFBE01010319.1/.p2 GENE.gb/GFBE01010319.1/~~gb/GFBE01010319.1/.p2  ORF type:complete len:229 (-),score=7.59 gb/GFBE01010319.1/:45-731(-)
MQTRHITITIVTVTSRYSASTCGLLPCIANRHWAVNNSIMQQIVTTARYSQRKSEECSTTKPQGCVDPVCMCPQRSALDSSLETSAVGSPELGSGKYTFTVLLCKLKGNVSSSCVKLWITRSSLAIVGVLWWNLRTRTSVDQHDIKLVSISELSIGNKGAPSAAAITAGGCRGLPSPPPQQQFWNVFRMPSPARSTSLSTTILRSHAAKAERRQCSVGFCTTMTNNFQ